LTAVIDVAVVDDHPIILESAASWIMADSVDIRLVATAATVGALLAGPGRRADVVLLDLDLGDGTTVDGNVAALLTAGPAVLVLSASDRPVAVRAAMRARAQERAARPDPVGDQRGRGGPGLDLRPPRLYLRHR
jgi:two-component system nitrate/nitrite response regulator NarL